MTSFNIYEAYAAVYNEDLREELLTEETILLESIEELYDDELEEIVEESIYSMLDEGYDIDEVEEIFEEVLSEMNPYAPAGSKAARQYAQSTTSSKKSAERKASRDATIGKIKGAVKSVVKSVKKTAGDIKSGAKEAKFKAVDAPAARYATKRGIGGPGPGLSARSKDPAKRRALRGAVVSDLTSRAKAKLSRGVDAVKSAGSAVKKGAKGLLGGAARAVSRGARDVARRLGEDVDLYDLVLEHLLDEGFADTEEAATVIMANMSEEWREQILGEGDNYDRNRQRAAQRAAARNAARKEGKTGNVPGVGYVSPRPEGETYRDSAGVERHTSGARMPSKDKKDN